MTTTTHKTLRGPRGGVILTNDEEIAKKINSAVFPGLQGGPLMHVIAAKAVAFGEALRPSFKVYAKNVVENAKALAETLKSKGYDITSGGTDTHLMLVDLRPEEADRQGVGSGARPRAHHLQQERHPVRSGKADRSPPASGSARRPAPRAASASPNSRQVGEMIAEVLDVLSQKRRKRTRWSKLRCARR